MEKLNKIFLELILRNLRLITNCHMHIFVIKDFYHSDLKEKSNALSTFLLSRVGNQETGIKHFDKRSFI